LGLNSPCESHLTRNGIEGVEHNVNPSEHSVEETPALEHEDLAHDADHDQGLHLINDRDYLSGHMECLTVQIAISFFAKVLLESHLLKDDTQDEVTSLEQVQWQQIVQQQGLRLLIEVLDQDLERLDLIVVEPLAIQDGLKKILALGCVDDPADLQSQHFNWEYFVRWVGLVFPELLLEE
jgi:hypothetical protein